MRFTDPTGHDWKDVIATMVDFAQGVGAQVGYNNTVVALPSEIKSLAPQPGESTSMQVGRFVGNVVTAVQGVAEISGGAGLGGAGVAACTTGVGCVATAPAVVSASAVIAHGATVATIGAVNAGTQLANAVMAVMDGGQDTGVHSVYGDGTPVYEGQEPPRLGEAKPDPDAMGPHSRLRWDVNNQRVYQAREFDVNGNPVRDIDFTNPTFPNGRVRPGHPGPPHQHSWIQNLTGGSLKRSNKPEILP